MVLFRGLGTGGASGVRTPLALAELWEFREGAPVRVREFTSWEEAMRAASLDPATVGKIGSDDR